MFLRLVSTLTLSTGLLCACDCIELPAKEAERSSEVVFRGTVVGFRDSDPGERMVIFDVRRVWKGRVRRQFEMPAVQGDWCGAFKPSLLKIGNDLVVYASRIARGTEYLPMPCNTTLARSTESAQALGRGRKPNSK